MRSNALKKPVVTHGYVQDNKAADKVVALKKAVPESWNDICIRIAAEAEAAAGNSADFEAFMEKYGLDKSDFA